MAENNLPVPKTNLCSRCGLEKMIIGVVDRMRPDEAKLPPRA